MAFFHKKESGGAGGIDFLIVGLGNPGAEYTYTRHNAGFLCADYIALQCGKDITRAKNEALYAEISLSGRRGLILKPQTYMNLSGKAVAAFASFYKIPPAEIIVLVDDVNFEAGRLRIRRKGSAGGHNGIKSIIECLHSEDFPRIKLGVGGKPHPDADLASHVLGRFSKTEITAMEGSVKAAYAACELMLRGETEAAMAKYNS